MSDQRNHHGIAIVGMGCRFPRAENLSEFWALLAGGQSTFEPIPAERTARHAVADLEGMIGTFLNNPFLFDHRHFKMPESEALFLDPQQRIMLELAVQTMEDGGYETLANQTVGVFIGANQMAYEEMLTSRWYRQKALEYLTELEVFQQLPDHLRAQWQAEINGLSIQENLPQHALVGNLTNMIAGRIAHELNLKGPAMTLDTACSSSLVAVHLACQALRNRECNLAFAGGINLNLSPSIFRYMKAAGVISPTGKCIPFSKNSDGILLGEGAGLVLLKRLEDAERECDPIWAVIRGTGMNNDGRSLSIMAPGWKGQLALLESTYSLTGFDPARISALEAHGTSTRIGDAVELSVIERFFPRTTVNPIAIGSVKSNIGHTLGAAGIAGLIKMALAVHHRQLPPSLYETVDPERHLDAKGIRVPSKLADWAAEGLRAAGVSSFGFGGTNAHLILEEHPVRVLERPAPRTVFQRQYFNFDFFPQLKPTDSIWFNLHWEPVGQYIPATEWQPEHWLILSADAGELTQLAAYWAAKGKTCFQVLLQDTPHFIRQSEFLFNLNPVISEHFRWLIQSLPTGVELGVLLTGRPAAGLEQMLLKDLLAFRHLLQAARQRSQTRLWVATRDAFQVAADQPVRPDQRALAVMAFGALSENDPLRGGLLDLDEQAFTPETLFQSLLEQAEYPLVLRDQQAFLPKLKAAEQSSAPKLKPGGIYLIVGGSSGVGAAMAAHLVQQGAGKVLVTGTRSAEKLPESLRVLGASVDYRSCSALDKPALVELLNEWFDRFPEIAGVVFAAGVVHYGALASKAESAFEQTLRTKMEGVQNLRDALRGKSVQTVYLMSSIAALAPEWAKGMADYAAANAYLEAFAAAQVPGPTRWMACSWGVWENTGMAAGVQVTGSRALPVGQALETFTASLAQGQLHQVVLPAAEQALFSFKFSQKIAAPAVVQKVETALSPPPEPTLAMNVLKPETGTYTAMLKSFIAAAIEKPDSEIDEKTSFYQIGLDSLSAVDVVFKIEKVTGFALDPTLLFEHDTIESLGAYLQQRSGTVALPVKEEAVLTDTLPLLPAQKTFFAQQMMFPDEPCNMLVTAEFDQALEIDRLQRVWDCLIEQNEALRMAYIMTDDGPRQMLQSGVRSPIERLRVPDSSGARKYEDELVNDVFDLAQPPLFRLVCVETDTGQTLLMLLLHHLVADAWSMHVLLESLLAGYKNHGENSTELPCKPGVSFRQYEQHFQRKAFNKNLSAQQTFWTQELANARIGIPLPYRQIRRKTGRYQAVRAHLSPEATRQVLESARRWQATSFHILLAAYFLTLRKHSRQSDLIARVAVANRDQSFPGMEQLIGCLADSIPLRVELAESDQLEQVALQVKKRMVAALRHTGLSAQEFVSLPISRSGNSPLVLSPAGISFLPMDYLAKDTGLSLTSVRGRSALNFTDLSLICSLAADQLWFSWNFSDQKFDPEDVGLMKDSMMEILTNGSVSQGLIDKVWAACSQHADRTAMISGNEQISYQALQDDSVRVSNTLLQLNLNLETAGILAYPGIPAVKGILGILGAGLAFIPFDPDWPDGRIETMVAHAGLKVLLTDSTQLPRLLGNQNLMASLEYVIVLDDTPARLEWPAGKVVLVNWAQLPKRLPMARMTSADSLAYVMYTSGTSGQPKGVMVQHQAVAVFLDWVSEAFQVDASCRFIHTSSLGFGGSIRQIFSTLLAGGVICPIARPALKDPQSLLAFLAEHKITMFNTVPTVLNNLLEWLEQDGVEPQLLPHLKWILVGGETLFSETVTKWYEHFGTAATIVNLYGSTETIVNATAFPVIPGKPLPAGAVPVGTEKKGSIVRLVNEQGAMCKLGEVGEIYVGGSCLAAGYYREPALTQQKFVGLLHLGLEGTFYRTGDLARADADGVLHFLGRNDDQIQVYGNRVEPLEIEEVLYQTRQVKNAAVVDHKKDTIHWLVAFVELIKTEKQPTEKELRAWIAARLPAYMVPHEVRVLDKMPLNHAGKTDRAALRRLLNAEQPLAIPEDAWTSTEETLAEVWKKVLRKSAVKRDDDFFELGGDSILMLEVLFQLRKHFNQVPKAVTLFRERKLFALAAEIDQMNSRQPTESMEEAGSDHAVQALSPAQKGFILIRDLHPEWSPNWSAMLQLTGELDLPKLEQAFQVMLQRHEMLRTVFIGRGGQAVPQVLSFVPQQLVFEDISGLSPEAQAVFLAQVFSRLKTTRFDLAQFPLFQLTVYQTAPGRWVLAMCLHHIVGDAWSMQVLFGDLLQAYDLCSKGQVPDLGPPPPSYRMATAYWLSQASTLNATRLQALRTFWAETLSALPSPAALSDGGTAETANEQLSLMLPAAVKDQLVKLSRAQGVSLFSTLLAMVARALKGITQADDLLVGTAVSGRDIPIGRVEKIVGCFARNLPLRIKLPGETTLREDITTVASAFLNAYEHQDIPASELFKLISQSGNSSIFSVNRYYFSFMDFSTIGDYHGEHLNILWDQSDYYFNSGDAGAELMLGVSVADQIRVQLHGYASTAVKARLLNLFQAEIQALSKTTDSLDVALIAYLPGDSWLRRLLPAVLQNGVMALAKQRLFPHRQPRLVERTETHFGVGGLVMLPADADALQAMTFPVLTRQIVDAVAVAVRNGARIVSLAGVLPTYTNYGFAVAQALQQQPWYHTGIKLTTGHSCTVVAVVKTIEKALTALAVDLRDMKVAVVGFGSIGQSSLMLLLRALGKPGSIIIADLAEQLPRLEKPMAALQNAFDGPVELCPVRPGEAPEAIYQADLVIGASSGGSMLDVARFKPGAVLVDDSFPPVVDQTAAIERMKTVGDVLFLGGGKLTLGVQQRQLLVPEIPESMLEALFRSTGDEGMPGCRIEPFVLLNSPELQPTLGLASPELIWQYWEKINALGISAVNLHLGGFLAPDDMVKNVGAIMHSAMHSTKQTN